jgi:uncharacterized protein YdaT
MPWTAADVKRHKKGLSRAQGKKWIEIANAVLRATGDDGKAIRIANSQTKKGK